MWYLKWMVWSCWETPGLPSQQQLAFSDHQEFVFCWTKNHLFLLQSFSIFLVSENSLNTYLSFVLNLNFKLYHYASLLQRRENDWQVDVTVISSLNLKLMIIYCKEALITDSTSPCSFSSLQNGVMRALIVSQEFRRFWENMAVSTDGWLFAETDSILNSSQVLFSLKEKI